MRYEIMVVNSFSEKETDSYRDLLIDDASPLSVLIIWLYWVLCYSWPGEHLIEKTCACCFTALFAL